MHSLMQVTSESDVKNAVQIAREKFGGLNVAACELRQYWDSQKNDYKEGTTPTRGVSKSTTG